MTLSAARSGRTTTSSRTRARTRTHRRNKFAYRCDRVRTRTELSDGRGVEGVASPDGTYPPNGETERTSALPVESNVKGRGGGKGGRVVIARLRNKGSGRSDSGTEKVTRLL